MGFRQLFRPALLRSLSTSLRWAGAAALVLIAFGVRYWLFGERPVLPYLLFFPPIILSAILFDRGSGIFATLLSTALSIYYFVPPTRSFAIPDAETALSIALFLGTGLFIAIGTEALHLAFVEVEESHAIADTARREAEQAARERDLLLVEFGHRVKNDLARISATIAMQTVGAGPETARALQAVSDRVKVLARVYDRLSRREGRVLVDMHDFLHDLISDLRTNLSDLKPIGLFIEAEHHSLSVSRAGALGLIVNELVTNALKHAFPEDREGAVRIGLWRDGPDLLLTVADDGVGLRDLPLEEVPQMVRQRGGMGRRLVRALAAQLGGYVVVTRTSDAGGVTHILRFPMEPPGEPVGQRV